MANMCVHMYYMYVCMCIRVCVCVCVCVAMSEGTCVVLYSIIDFCLR